MTIFVIVGQYSLVAYFYYMDGYIDKINYIATVFMLIFGYFIGKQFDKVKFYSEKDVLTNLYNRRFVMNNFEKITSLAQRIDSKLFILVIDCDNFKNINDSYGHLKGDHILELIGKSISDTTRKSDIVARWGGDEFLIIGHIKDESGLTAFLQRLDESLHDLSKKTKIHVSVSIGSALFPNDSTDLFELIKIADDHMYNRKQLRKENK